MYILSKDNRPFAIIKNDWGYRVEQAVAEEYGYEEVGIVEEISFPDWGETKELEYVALDENGEEITDSVEITKLVDY